MLYVLWRSHLQQEKPRPSLLFLHLEHVMYTGQIGQIFSVTFLNQFLPLPSTAKQYANSTEENFNIFRKDINTSGKKPTPIISKGLDAKRQWYLYDEIGQFCSTNISKDLTCPKPLIPRPEVAQGSKQALKQYNDAHAIKIN